MKFKVGDIIGSTRSSIPGCEGPIFKITDDAIWITLDFPEERVGQVLVFDIYFLPFLVLIKAKPKEIAHGWLKI